MYVYTNATHKKTVDQPNMDTQKLEHTDIMFEKITYVVFF
jgi:hypothetical protein